MSILDIRNHSVETDFLFNSDRYVVTTVTLSRCHVSCVTWQAPLTYYCSSWPCHGPCCRRPGPGPGPDGGGEGGGGWGRAPAGGSRRRWSRAWPWPAAPWVSWLRVWGADTLNICGGAGGHKSDLTFCRIVISSHLRLCLWHSYSKLDCFRSESDTRFYMDW